MNLYESSIKIKEKGGVPLGNMITEAAIPKLMWVLGQTQQKKDNIIDEMLTDVAGELL